MKNKPDKHDTEALATVLNCRAKQAAKAKTSCKRKRCSKIASESKRRCLSSLEFSPLNLSLFHPCKLFTQRQSTNEQEDKHDMKAFERLSNRSDKEAAKENAVPKLHHKVSGDVSRHWNSARWIYLCFILANSSHKDNQPMNKRTNMTWKHLQDCRTAVTNKLQKKTLFQNCISK